MVGIFKIRRLAYRAFIWSLNNFVLHLPSNGLRVALLRATGAKVGRGTRIERGVKLDFPWRLRIGENSTINPGVYLDCRGDKIHIGNYVDISSDAIVYTLTHDIHGLDFAVRSGPVELSDSVWICTRAIILPTCHIGAGSVIGANSVIKGRIASNQLWQGNPAAFRKSLPIGRGSTRRYLD